MSVTPANPKPISPLRARMIEDMTVRNFGATGAIHSPASLSILAPASLIRRWGSTLRRSQPRFDLTTRCAHPPAGAQSS